MADVPNTPENFATAFINATADYVRESYRRMLHDTGLLARWNAELKERRGE
jgi:hypothetical protein